MNNSAKQHNNELHVKTPKARPAVYIFLRPKIYYIPKTRKKKDSGFLNNNAHDKSHG